MGYKMIRDGFYKTSVSGPFGESNGVVAVNDSRFNGGDDYMVYTGGLREADKATIRAKVYREADIYSGKVFDLTAKLVNIQDGFLASGFYPDGAPFSLTAKFIAGPDL